MDLSRWSLSLRINLRGSDGTAPVCTYVLTSVLLVYSLYTFGTHETRGGSEEGKIEKCDVRRIQRSPAIRERWDRRTAGMESTAERPTVRARRDRGWRAAAPQPYERRRGSDDQRLRWRCTKGCRATPEELENSEHCFGKEKIKI